MRVGKQRHLLLRWVVDVLYLEKFKASLDRALRNLILLEMSLQGTWNK